MVEPLYIWTVFDHAADYPEAFVARLFKVVDGIVSPTESIVVSEYLSVVREVMMEMGLTMLPRSETDEPQIVECWI